MNRPKRAFLRTDHAADAEFWMDRSFFRGFLLVDAFDILPIDWADSDTEIIPAFIREAFFLFNDRDAFHAFYGLPALFKHYPKLYICARKAHTHEMRDLQTEN